MKKLIILIIILLLNLSSVFAENQCEIEGKWKNYYENIKIGNLQWTTKHLYYNSLKKSYGFNEYKKFGTFKEYEDNWKKYNYTLDKGLYLRYLSKKGGTNFKGYENVYSGHFSLDGKHFGFIGRKSLGKIKGEYQSNVYIVADGINKILVGTSKSPYFEIHSFDFLDNGKLYYIYSNNEKKSFIVIDGKEYSLGNNSNYYYSSYKEDTVYIKNNNIIFFGEKDNKWFLMKNGINISKQYTSAKGFNVSLNGKFISIQNGNINEVYELKGNKLIKKGDYNGNFIYLGNNGDMITYQPNEYIIRKNGNILLKGKSFYTISTNNKSFKYIEKTSDLYLIDSNNDLYKNNNLVIKDKDIKLNFNKSLTTGYNKTHIEGIFNNGKDILLSNKSSTHKLIIRDGKVINTFLKILVSPDGKDYFGVKYDSKNLIYSVKNGFRISYQPIGYSEDGNILLIELLNKNSKFIIRNEYTYNTVNSVDKPSNLGFIYDGKLKILDDLNKKLKKYNKVESTRYELIKNKKGFDLLMFLKNGINNEGKLYKYKIGLDCLNSNNLGEKKEESIKENNIKIINTSYKNSSVTINLKAKGSLLKIYKKVGKNDVKKGKEIIKKIIKKKISNDKAKKIFENISSKFVKLANKKDLTKLEVKNIKKYTVILYLLKDVYENENFMDPRAIKDGYLLKDIFPDFKF